MPKVRHYATIKEVQLLLNYCEHTGHFYWKEADEKAVSHFDPEAHNRKAGTRADFLYHNATFKPIRLIRLFGANMSAASTAFILKTGRKPYRVYHLDGNLANNRWANLSEKPPRSKAKKGDKFTVRISENLRKISIENP